MRGIILLFAIIFLIALAGYIIRPSSRPISNLLYVIAGMLLVLLGLALSGVIQ